MVKLVGDTQSTSYMKLILFKRRLGSKNKKHAISEIERRQKEERVRKLIAASIEGRAWLGTGIIIARLFR